MLLANFKGTYERGLTYNDLRDVRQKPGATLRPDSKPLAQAKPPIKAPDPVPSIPRKNPSLRPRNELEIELEIAPPPAAIVGPRGAHAAAVWSIGRRSRAHGDVHREDPRPKPSTIAARRPPTSSTFSGELRRHHRPICSRPLDLDPTV